jgi:hypothetical protein
LQSDIEDVDIRENKYKDPDPKAIENLFEAGYEKAMP